MLEHNTVLKLEILDLTFTRVQSAGVHNSRQASVALNNDASYTITVLMSSMADGYKFPVIAQIANPNKMFGSA